MSDLKSFIKKTLKTYVPSLEGDKFDRFVDQASMKIWERAFTHESYDPEPSNNYEPLETEGDRVLDLVFTSYIMEYYEKVLEQEITPQFITNLKHYYMSKIQQEELSRKLGLPDHVRKSRMVTLDVNIVEDLFESFFGALYRIGNNIVYGFGMMISYSFFRKLFDDVDIDESKRFGDSKTVVIQTFEQMGWGKSGPDVDTYTDTDEEGRTVYTVSLSFNRKALDMLEPKVKGKVEIPRTVVTKKSTSIRRAENEAYDYFNAYMNKLGITRDFVKRFREKQVFNEYGELYVDAKEKAEDQGYKTISFAQQRTGPGKKKFYIQLIGTTKDDKSVMLEAVLADDASKGKEDVLKKYVK